MIELELKSQIFRKISDLDQTNEMLVFEDHIHSK